MTITITDEQMTSDTTRHSARAWLVPGEPTLWTVTWLPVWQLTRNQAITAMVLAEEVTAWDGDVTGTAWLVIEAHAGELGLSAVDAVGRISYHGVDLSTDPCRERP